MSDNFKAVSTDVHEFSDFIENDCYYVDKTNFIKDIMKDGSKTMLFTRPRRFGKSITLSMLKSFLEINYEDPSDKSKQIELFKDTEIFKDKEFCDKYMGQYPVIRLCLKDAFSQKSSEIASNKIFDELGSVAEKFKFLKDSDKLDDDLKKNLQELIDLRDQKVSSDQKWVRGTSFLSDLMSILNAVTSKEVVVLIDEYDVPLSKASHTDFYQDIKDIIYNLFSSGLKNNSVLKKGIITGCLRVAKESIFTGLNNFVPIDFNDPRFNCLFGFTENEVKTMLNYYDQEYSTTKLFGIYKEWYDGYHFGSAEIYCPWDVLNFTDQIIELNDLTPKAFWIGTSSNLLPQDVFNDNPDLYVDNFETLIHGGSIEVKKDDFLNYNQLSNSKEADHFWNLLYATGYLTVAKDKTPSNDKNIVLTIPNHCVKECLEDLLKWCFTKSNPKFSKYFHPLIDALYEGNCRKITKILDDTLNRYISFYDYGKNSPKEMYYQGFINGIFSEICQSDARAYDYLPNVELGKGRADAVFYISPEDFDAETVGIVLELKVAKDEGSKKQFASLALDQIEEKEYAISYLKKDDSLDKVKYFGIAFFGKKCQVVCKEIKR